MTDIKMTDPIAGHEIARHDKYRSILQLSSTACCGNDSKLCCDDHRSPSRKSRVGIRMMRENRLIERNNLSVRMKPSFMDKAPTGTLGVSAESGWINEQLFTQWFDHFVESTQPAACQSKTLLILDGHSSYAKNYEVIQKARESNVIILSLPSHCTHRLQPLDVSFFKVTQCTLQCCCSDMAPSASRKTCHGN